MMTKRLTTRGQAGISLFAFGVLLMAVSGAMVFRAAPAFALDDPTNPNKELICHNLTGPPSPSDGISVDKSALKSAHLDAGHTYDIIEGIFSVSLGRIAVAADVATILADGTIVWLCGDSTAVTTTTTTTTLGSTTTTILGGPCSPTDPDCLPNTGGSNLMSVLLAGLGLLLVGVGLLAMANERHRGLTR